MRCNHIAIAAYELWRFRRMFLVFLAMATLLISVTLSIFQLSHQLPDQIANQYENELTATVDVNGIYENELDWVVQKDMKIGSVRTNVELNDVTLGERAASLGGQDFYIFGDIVWETKGEPTASAELLNQYVTVGSNWSDRTMDAGASIWMSEEIAVPLGLAVGDSVPLYRTDGSTACTCILTGTYPSESFMAQYYITLETCRTLCPSGVAMNYSVSGVPYCYQDYMRIIRLMQKNHFGVSCMGLEILESYTLLLYMLYGFCMILCLCMVSLCYNMIRLYFERRLSFFGVQRAIGMTRRDLSFVTIWVSIGVMTCAFVCAMALTPLILNYVIYYINSLFEGLNLRRQLSLNSVAVVLGICLLLPVLSCLLEYKVLKRMNASEILRKA